MDWFEKYSLSLWNSPRGDKNDNLSAELKVAQESHFWHQENIEHKIKTLYPSFKVKKKKLY